MSLFGQAATAPSAPSLFGGTATPLFGASAGQSQFGAPQPTQPSLFGALQQSQLSLPGAPVQGQQPQQQGSSIFGTTGVAQPQTSLFGPPSQGGAPSAGQPQPSLFGGNASQPGLFGGATSQPGLFGAQPQPSQFSSQSQPSPFGGISGAISAQSQSALGFGSGFVVGQQQPTQFQQTQQGSLFQLQPQQASLFQPQQYAQFQAQNPVPASTRVDQLPPKAIELLESVQKRLWDQRAKASHLIALQVLHEENMRVLRDGCASSHRRLVRADTGVEALTTNANALHQAMRDDRRAADNVAHSLAQLCRSLDPLGSSNAWYNAYSYTAANELGPVPPFITHVNPVYFTAVVSELEERAKAYKREIDQIAEFLRMEGAGYSAASHGFDALEARMHNSRNDGVISAGNEGYVVIGSAGTSRRRAEAKGHAIEDIIRRQFEYFMMVANKTAAVHEPLARRKENYLADARRQDPDAVDPFAQADSRERAEDEKRRRIAAAIQPSGLLTAGRSSPPAIDTSNRNGQLRNLGSQPQSLAISGFNAITSNPADPSQQPVGPVGVPAPTSLPTPSASPGFTGFGAVPGGSPPGGFLGSSTARRPTSSGSGTRRHRSR
jgi:hypothetical protein